MNELSVFLYFASVFDRLSHVLTVVAVLAPGLTAVWYCLDLVGRINGDHAIAIPPPKWLVVIGLTSVLLYIVLPSKETMYAIGTFWVEKENLCQTVSIVTPKHSVLISSELK